MNIFSNMFKKPNLPNDLTASILGKYLNSDFTVFPMAENKIAIEDLNKLENESGVIIHKEFKAHLCGQFPGIYVEVKESIWPRAKAYDVGPFWSFLHGIHTYTPSKDSDEWMRMDFGYEYYLKCTGKKVLPILKVVGDADVYCMSQDSQIIRYNHESNDFEGIDKTFFELFESEIASLVERRNKKLDIKNKIG